MKKILLGLAFVASTSIFADVKGGKIGIDFSYGTGSAAIVGAGTAGVGVWWHITDMFAVRPSVGYSSTTKTTTGDSTNSSLVFSIAVPIYLVKFNLLNMYVAPEFGYSSTTVTPAAPAASYTQNGFGIAAALGTQVAINDQLHIFGELGFGYVNSTDASTTPSTKTTGFGTVRSSIGAIFYFN